VHIGLTFQAGTKPVVLVLPIPGVGGDSAHNILERDLDYGDRVRLISLTDAGLGSAQGAPAVNYPLAAKLGADVMVQAFLATNSLHVVIHDVAHKRIADVRVTELPPTIGSPDWRMAIHGAADEVERIVTGVRGVAQTRIAFVRDGQIYTVDSDGAEARAVSPGGNDPMSPAWDPAGRHLTYSVFGPRGTVIVVEDLKASTVRSLTATPGGVNASPDYSPDGLLIAYAHGDEDGTDIYVVPSSLTEPARRVTIGHGSDNIQPTFSPDGERLAFTSGRSGHPEVYITDIDGTNPVLLTPYEFGDDYYRSSPDWSPDGRLIAFQSRISGQFQVMTIGLRDHAIKQLTSDGINEDPSWAPDSRHLVFTSNRTGSRQLWVLDAESGRARQLTFGGAARLAAWSRPLPSP
jgi:TolB protein